MIKVTVGNNVSREAVIVSADTTLRQVLEDNGIDYSTGSMHLDGVTLRPGDLDKTFADFGIQNSTFLLNMAKTDNA